MMYSPRKKESRAAGTRLMHDDPNSLSSSIYEQGILQVEGDSWSRQHTQNSKGKSNTTSRGQRLGQSTHMHACDLCTGSTPSWLGLRVWRPHARSGSYTSACMPLSLYVHQPPERTAHSSHCSLNASYLWHASVPPSFRSSRKVAT